MINTTITINIREELAENAVDASIRDAQGNVIGIMTEENMLKLKEAVTGQRVFILKISSGESKGEVRSQISDEVARGDVLGEALNQFGKALARGTP